MNESKKVIWAVDCQLKDDSLFRTTESFLRGIVSNFHFQVEPVCVFTPDSIDVSMNFSRKQLEEQMKKRKVNLQEKLKHLDIPLLPPKVLLELSISTINPFDALTSYALKQKAEFICVSTRGRQGLSRVLFGSFAEKLFHYSPVPVFVVSGKSECAGKLKKVLVPTDFTRSSREVFRRLIRLAKLLKFEILIYHLGKEDRIWRRGVHWVQYAKKNGVESSFLAEDSERPTPFMIQEAAKRSHCQAIAMATHGHDLKVDRTGSVACELVRQSEQPVWVFSTGRVVSPSDKNSA